MGWFSHPISPMGWPATPAQPWGVAEATPKDRLGVAEATPMALGGYRPPPGAKKKKKIEFGVGGGRTTHWGPKGVARATPKDPFAGGRSHLWGPKGWFSHPQRPIWGWPNHPLGPQGVAQPPPTPNPNFFFLAPGGGRSPPRAMGVASATPQPVLGGGSNESY
jgi:hypothetical protein